MSETSQGLTTEKQSGQTQETGPSFTDRYYNEAPTKSVGGSRSVRSVSQSIPYGSENGGLTDWFKEKILRKKPKTDDEDDGVEMEVLGQMTDESEDDEDEFADLEPVDVYDENGNLIEVKSDEYQAHQEMLELAEEIKNDTKTRAGVTLKDGDIYTALKEALTELTRLLAAPIPDKKENAPSFKRDSLMLTYWYRMAIEHCQRYIEHIKNKKQPKKSAFGKRRLAQAETLLPILQNELYWMNSFIHSADMSKTDRTFNDVLYELRSIDLSVNDPSVEVTGNGASIIYKKTEEDGKVSFIKREDRLADNFENSRTIASLYVENSGGHSFFDNAYAYFLAHKELEKKYGFEKPSDIIRAMVPKLYVGLPYKPLPKDETRDAVHEENLSLARTRIEDFKEGFPEYITYIKDPAHADELDEFINFETYTRKKDNEGGAAKNASIREGSVVSDRNVSSSILARKIGMGDMIAESESAILELEDGRKVRGSSMAKVSGKSYPDIEEEAKEEKKKLNKGKRKHEIRIVYTPKCLKQLQMLHIFDMISGQADRNFSNYLFEYEKTQDRADKNSQIWYLTSVAGIDNDMSFGNMSSDQLSANKGIGPYLVSFFEDGGYAKINAIRYLPKEFYERIMAYSPEEAALDQAHLRTTEELEALKDRLLYVQTELRRRVEIAESVKRKLGTDNPPSEKELADAEKFGITLTENDEQDLEAFNKMVEAGDKQFATYEERKTAEDRYFDMDKSGYVHWAFMRKLSKEDLEPQSEEEPKKKRKHKSKHKAKEEAKEAEKSKKKKKSKPKGGKKKSDYHKKKEEEEDDVGVELE